jgi:membrane-bound lytic murein transglycosylase MltF
VTTILAKPFTGDVDQMVARRLNRVGITCSRTFYFADKGVRRGVAYEFAKAFEDWLNDGQYPFHKGIEWLNISL